MRSAYGPAWTLEANRRRLAVTEGVTIRSLASQTSRDFGLVVLLHRLDDLLEERQRAFARLGATFLYLDDAGLPSEVAFAAYRAGWADAVGSRDDSVAMTRLDDDDGFAPWAMAKVREVTQRVTGRTALMFPHGVRVWQGGYTVVRHTSNAMHTLVTPPGDAMTVYDYGHRRVRQFAPVRLIDRRPAWIWSRHPDTISGWRRSDMPLNPLIRGMFDIDWSLFGTAYQRQRVPLSSAGRVFR